MTNVHKIGLFFLAVSCLQSRSIAQTCPPPPTSIDPSLSSSVAYDVNTQSYIYRYTLQNGNRSGLPINYFALLLAQQPSDIQSPMNWISRYISQPTGPSNLRWATIVPSPSSPLNIGGSDLATPAYAIQPGAQLKGFSIRSSQPPGILKYYVQGFTQIPSATATPSDDEPDPNCPGWDFQSPYLKTLVIGIATGPSNPNVISVAIRLRKGDGQQPYGPINPNNPNGNISVLVLSSPTFDASKIIVSSIQFGPANAAPLSSKLVASKSGKDTQSGEREEWEIIHDDFDRDLGGNRNSDNLLLIFDLKSLGVQCVLDKALFLTGTTQSGEGIIGGVSPHALGCDVRHPGQRR